jgi:AraC-like DNA-binding protein
MDGLAGIEGSFSDPPMPRNLSRAVSYLRENLREPLTLPMLVQASGLSERTLHKQFRRFLGMTPVAYLRRLRLLAAREALRRPVGPGVSEVALTGGFAHLGRFSIAYKAAFGETPSATRQRAQAQVADSIMLSQPGYVRPVLVLAPPRTETLAERRQAADLWEHLASVLAQSHAITVCLFSREPAVAPADLSLGPLLPPWPCRPPWTPGPHRAGADRSAEQPPSLGQQLRRPRRGAVHLA